MDRTEQLEQLKKELFNINFQLQMSKRDFKKCQELSARKDLVKKKIALLMLEEKVAEGQMGFAFAEQIDEGKLESVPLDTEEEKKSRRGRK